jgi:rSAM/selenodomain-associated transferase 1
MDEDHSKCAVLMLKYPEAGMVKTRLAAEIGDKQALALYLAFINDTLETLSGLDFDIILSIYRNETGSDESANPFGEYPTFRQRGRDLGERQYNSLEDAYGMGYDKVFLLAGDSPDIESDFIAGAADTLDHADAVIGPCEDGGYYLLGVKKECLDIGIFHGIEWGSEKVMDGIRHNFKKLGMTLFELPIWYDIDTLDDLRRLEVRSSDGIRARRTIRLIPEFPEEEPILDR